MQLSVEGTKCSWNISNYWIYNHYLYSTTWVWLVRKCKEEKLKPWLFSCLFSNGVVCWVKAGTEQVVNNMIRWCVQDKRSFRLAKLPRAALVSPFHPALQDMFLQCEGFESLPLPPAIRTVAVDAAWPNAHSFWVGGVSFNGLKSQVFRCIFMVVRAVLGRVFMCLYIGLNVEAF